MTNFHGRQWKLLVLKKPLLCLPKSELAQELFSKSQVLKIDAYNRNRRPGSKVIPLDKFDYVSDHYLLCECIAGIPTHVRCAFRHTNLSDIDYYGLEHPLEYLFGSSGDNSLNHFEFIKEEMSSLTSQGGELTYISRMCMDDVLLSSSALKRFAWKVFKSAQVREKSGNLHHFMMGHLTRYKLSGLFESLGYLPITWKQPLGAIKHKVFGNEGVLFYVSKEFTSEAVAESSTLDDFWASGLVIGEFDEFSAPEQTLRVA